MKRCHELLTLSAAFSTESLKCDLDWGRVVLTGDGALMVTQAQLESNDPVCAAAVLKSVSQTLGR